LEQPRDALKNWDYKESITIRLFELHHGDTESTELLLFFIQSGNDDWIKVTLAMNGCFFFAVISRQR
jgi:hypothetical protein